MLQQGLKGTLDCVPSWLTDFRNDLPRIDVPTLIFMVMPIASCHFSQPQRLSKLIENSQLVIIPADRTLSTGLTPMESSAAGLPRQIKQHSNVHRTSRMLQRLLDKEWDATLLGVLLKR